MSRNLSTTRCYFCGALPKLDEEPRPITEADAHMYFEEYEGMLVAKATCPDCLASYLAWVDMRSCKNSEHRRWASYTIDEQTHFDLSFRSSFNDEPDLADMPVFKIATKKLRTGLYLDGDHWLDFYKRHYPEKHAAHIERLQGVSQAVEQKFPEELGDEP